MAHAAHYLGRAAAVTGGAVHTDAEIVPSSLNRDTSMGWAAEGAAGAMDVT